MAQPRTIDLVLTGHYAGKTVTLNGYTFNKGVLALHGTADKTEGVVTYMRSYSAFPRGSRELELMQERDNGERDVHGEVDATGRVDESGVRPEGTEPVQAPANVVAGDDGTPPHGERGVSERGGYEHAGVSVGASQQASDDPAVAGIRKALMSLDPENNEFWTDAGLPTVAAVAHATDTVGLTRRDIETALPGFTRDSAREAHDV